MQICASKIQQLIIANTASFESSSTDVASLNFQKEKFLRSYTIFSVSIDGIVFNDGTFVGEDQNLFFETLEGNIQARKDVLTALASDKAAGKKDTDILDEILSNNSNIYLNLAEIRSANVTREQIFNFSYKTYLKNLRSELVMKRTQMHDADIVSQLQSVKISDFVTLQKIED